MTNHVVVGVDLSEPSTTTARWVARHIARDDGDLVLVHVICVPQPPSFLRGLFAPTDQLVEDARRGADLRLRELSHSLEARRVRPEIRVGRIDDQLLDAAAEFRSNLLVVGPHTGRQGLGKLLVSTAEHVIRRATTSVLLGRGLPAEGLKTVLVALDESTTTRPVLDWAARLAGNGVRVVVLHVLDPFAYGAIGVVASGPEGSSAERQLRESAEAWMRARIAEVPLENVVIETRLGNVALEILGAVEQLGADLLVLGRHGSGAGRGGDMGRVAEFLLRNGTGPVLVVAAGPGMMTDGR